MSSTIFCISIMTYKYCLEIEVLSVVTHTPVISVFGIVGQEDCLEFGPYRVKTYVSKRGKK